MNRMHSLILKSTVLMCLLATAAAPMAFAQEKVGEPLGDRGGQSGKASQHPSPAEPATGSLQTYGQAQSQKPDVMPFVLDFMKVSDADGELNMVFWMPEEFWTATARLHPDVSRSQAEVIAKVVRPYTIVGVSSGKTRPFATPEYRTEPEIRELVRLKDSNGNTYTPFAPNQLDPSLAGFLAIGKTVMERVAGTSGRNMYFCVFPAKIKDGARICDPMKEGRCEVDVGSREFKWRLPIASLLPKQKCPVCGEVLSGAYKYCPYDGTRLAGTAIPSGDSGGGAGDSNKPTENPHAKVSTEGPIILSDTGGVDFGPYLARVTDLVRQNWHSEIPESARKGDNGRVSIVFEILKDGSMRQWRLVASSGSEALDRAAAASIRASNPLPPLPSEFTGKHLLLQFNFLYNLGGI